MKKILNLTLQNNFQCSLDDASQVVLLSKSQTIELIKKYNCFCIENEVVKYIPPYGIYNKKTLEDAINGAFPKGLYTTKLKECYEFVESDLHEIEFNNNLYTLFYGKSNEKVIFAKYNAPNIRLKNLWDEALAFNENIPVIFKLGEHCIKKSDKKSTR